LLGLLELLGLLGLLEESRQQRQVPWLLQGEQLLELPVVPA
jgi:hypothetical protein